MSVPVIFNRRLGKNELDLLFDILPSNEIDRVQARNFFQLEDSIAFVSSLEDEIIGGTVIYRDRTRLGMVLAAIAIEEKHRNLGAYTITKSSLPFFRTVAIRDVDAVIATSQEDTKLKFPFSFQLPSWIKQVLEKNEFVAEQNLYSCKLEVETDDTRKYKRIPVDSIPNTEGTKSLIWDTGKSSGLTNSIVWMSLDFAAHSETLQTISEGETTKLAYSLIRANEMMIIGFIATTEDFMSSSEATKALSSIIIEEQVGEISFPLIGRGQLKLIESIAEEIGGRLKSESITLMRRRL